MFTEITKERGSKNKIIKLGTTNCLTKMTDEKGELLPIFKEIKTNLCNSFKLVINVESLINTRFWSHVINWTCIYVSPPPLPRLR